MTPKQTMTTTPYGYFRRLRCAITGHRIDYRYPITAGSHLLLGLGLGTTVLALWCTRCGLLASEDR